MIKLNLSEQPSYPFLFDFKLKEVLWGGSRICVYKGLEPVDKPIGESWELCHMSDYSSTLCNGALAGKTLAELIEIYAARLLGKQVLQRFGPQFPLLIKFIDARENLSIQVHPDDELAQTRHQSWGKTEMWYLIDAEPDATIYVGWKESMSPAAYVEALHEGSLVDKIKCHEAKVGDVFYLPAGRVHAIGAGCFLAEIQQSSDITYRLYDYERCDAEGKKRELHTEQALEAIDYTAESDYRTSIDIKAAQAIHSLVHSPYFHTQLIDLQQPLQIELAERDSFTVYICIEGAVDLRDANGANLRIAQGQTALIAAETPWLSLIPEGKCKLLETYIPKL